MSDESEILFERRGALGLITLNRPKALNALTHGMCLEMTARLEAWAHDGAIKSVAVRGASSPHQAVTRGTRWPTRAGSSALR